MKPIQNPPPPAILPNSNSGSVANVQDALLFLIEQERLRLPAEVRDDLQRDRGHGVYRDGTARAVLAFREQFQLEPGEIVDEATARALNQALRELGAFDDEFPSAAHIVSGVVRREDGFRLQGMRVRAVQQSEQGDIRLGEDKTDVEGQYTIRYEPLPAVSVVRLRLDVLDEAGVIVLSLDLTYPARTIEVVDLVVPFVQFPSATRQVEGRVVFDHGAPAEGLNLRLYRVGFGGAEGATLLKETTSREHGLYSLPYTVDGQVTSLEVRALDSAGEEIVLSEIIKDAGQREVLNLVVPAQARPLAAEFTRLAGDLQPHIGDTSLLAAAHENAQQRDLTILHESTGWDARLLATAAMATKLSAAEETGLPQDTLYGLLRAGLPSDKLQLARVSTEAFDHALSKVRAAGIVDLSNEQAAQLKQEFDNFSVNTRLAVPAPGSRATYGELLNKLDLSENDQKTFAKLYLNHRGDARSLWDKVTEAGLGDSVPKLQRQGKLAFLTTNNPELTMKLQTDLGENGLEQLVNLGLYKKEKWLDLIDVVPPAYADAANPKESYAEDMARKVRISYSTEVTWNMIETGELSIDGGNANLSAFLRSATGKGFKLGQTPIDAFISTNPDVFDGVPAADQRTTTEMVKTLQRVYQITPGNDAMKVLLNEGLLSAQDVVAYPLDVFLERFVSPLLSEEQARLVYRKAEQVSNVTYSLFSLAKELESAPTVFAISAPSAEREAAKKRLVKHFPTMESLFGSLDYCECEHCRSVLSPAAYLVDLLQFLDREPKIWKNTLKDWEKKHGNAPYPFKNLEVFNEFLTRWQNDHAGEPAPDTRRTPYDVLVERRPDLPHIQLTCENTNTALPQIDLVNEILEYYVANNTLKADAARDTGDATSPDLLAEPQYVIAEAYNALQQARYPLALPFDLWIETARQFSAYFEVPLWSLLETFRKSDDLFAPDQAYDRAAMFFETLGLSPAEISIFTDPDPLPRWFELYGFANENDALTEAVDPDTGQRIDLNSAKALSRRLGVSYKELFEIIRAGFVNPTLASLVTLRKLEVQTADIFFYQEHRHLLNENETSLSQQDRERLAEVKGFERRLDDLTARYDGSGVNFNARNWLEAALQGGAFDSILVLADPAAGSNFDLTTLRYADGDKIDSIALLRINLFVRLWRKLGWSIEETDCALQTFVPKNAPFDENNLSKRPLNTALIYISHLKTLEAQLQLGKDARLKLLSLWAPLTTTGKNPLYGQLFLKRAILKSDPVFDHPLGSYLNNPNLLVKDHLLPLQSVLGVTAEEIIQILKDSGNTLATAPLSLNNVSLLYRYTLLAKALRLSILQLVTLKEMTGLDPFVPLHPDPLADTPQGVDPAKKALEFDYPFIQTLRFIEIVEQVRESGFTIEDLDYLLRHRFDETGKYRLDLQATLALIQDLSDGIRAIRSEHAVPDTPDAMSDDVLRQKVSLILPAAVVERFWAMMNGSAEFSVAKPNVVPDDQLSPPSFVGELAIGQLAYNAPRQEQKLTFRGVLFDAQKAELKDKFSATLTAGQQATLASLLDMVQAEGKKQATDFFTKHLQEQKLSTSAMAGFLKQADLEKLFQPPPVINDDLPEEQKKQAREANEGQLREKRQLLQKTFLPFLQRQLIRQLVASTLSAATGTDASLVESLLTDKALLADPTRTTEPLLNAFVAAAENGLTARFFAAPDGAGEPLASLTLADADTTAKDSAGTAKPPGTNSARFEGYLEVPAAGAYRFYATLSKKDAAATLRFAHVSKPIFAGKAAQDNDEIGKGPDEFVELKPRVLYRFTLDVQDLGGGDAQLWVQGETLPKDRLVQLPLFSQAAFERGLRAHILLVKSLQLIQTLGLNERELRYILTHADDFDGISLTELPTRQEPRPREEAIALFHRVCHLIAYARLKRELAGGGDDFIDVFEASKLDDAYERIAHIARLEKAAVQATAETLFAAPSFANEESLRRLWEALRLVETFGVPVAAMEKWTGIAKAAAAPDDHKQRAAIARELKEVIKARFEPDAWLRVAQPIHDKLRQRQRDALVAYILHQRRFDRIEQLFEYFLIDPGVEPVVQTSRIRSAIAAVQIFIHRCLLNLEPQVAAAAINSKQWQWMKRYPVWAGNRRLWLFPENVLEPEFRDDKSHLFAELEGTLLQGDVNNDLAEDAFFNYLKSLDELARLEIVGMYCEEQPLDPASNQLHVIGRTYSEPHKYFYRRFTHGVWTPWEPMPIEIEGNHIVPVVWRNRLNVFWVTFIDNPDPSAVPTDNTGAAAKYYAEDQASLKITTVMSGGSNNSSKSLADMSMGQLAGGLRAAVNRKLMKAQLHWSEYFQGAWSVRESGGYGASLTKSVGLFFDSTRVFIHVTKDYDDETGEERGVRIHLGGLDLAFRIVSRNSRPSQTAAEPAPPIPYSATEIQANRYGGQGALKVTFAQRIETEVGKAAKTTMATPGILQQGGQYNLLPCANRITLGTDEIASLVTPVFYQDDRSNTFYVEPTFKEKTIEEWQEWVTRTPEPEVEWDDSNWWDKLPLNPMIPKPKIPIPINPGDPIWQAEIDRRARFSMASKQDWLANPATVVQFDSELIGPTGRVGLAVQPMAHSVSEDGVGGAAVHVNPGSAVRPGNVVVAIDSGALSAAGLTAASGGLNVIGSNGLNSALSKNVNIRRTL